MKKRVKDIFSKGPFTAKQAVIHGLVDELYYPSEVYNEILPQSFNMEQKKFKFLYFHHYLNEICFKGKGTVIALITCEGPIHEGKSEKPGFSDPTIGHETVVKAIEAATKDNKVKAILLRIESGGGSYVASDHIAQALIKAKEKGKKIVVSMSNVAASGGYFIAHNSDSIVANPMTLTGSIGVVGGKFNTRQFWGEHLGVTFDGVKESENSDLFSSIEGMSEENAKRYEALLDEIYSDFKSKIVKGRSNPELNEGNIDEVAKGRVWMGITARNIKLVDHLGGFVTALNVTRELLDLKESDPIKLEEYPKKPSFLKLLLGQKKSSREDDKTSVSIPKTIMGSLGMNFMQTAIIGAVGQFFGLNLNYNPLLYHTTLSNSQFNLLSPNLSLDFLSKD
jgi:protease-4